ncbi:hypothetical protein F2Q70_00044571 [Brassica cretica]|uniref:Uncharacterized protein n=1 Tax=Brassica cretica TaxID=69181 RepID=A0A8S9KK29_BRACR|nr:hypothetical protein F2Q70_00044571 [Brassica cretica]
MLCNQTFKLDQVTFTVEGLKDAHQPKRNDANCRKDEDMDDEMMDLLDVSSEIQEKLGSSNDLHDGLDKDDSMGGQIGAQSARGHVKCLDHPSPFLELNMLQSLI